MPYLENIDVLHALCVVNIVSASMSSSANCFSRFGVEKLQGVANWRCLIVLIGVFRIVVSSAITTRVASTDSISCIHDIENLQSTEDSFYGTVYVSPQHCYVI